MRRLLVFNMIPRKDHFVTMQNAGIHQAIRDSSGGVFLLLGGIRVPNTVQRVFVSW